MTTVEFPAPAASDVLVLPWAADAPLAELRVEGLSAQPIVRRFRLAQGRIDTWHRIPLTGRTPAPLRLTSPSPALAGTRLLPGSPELASTAVGVVLPFGEGCDLLGTPSAGVVDLVTDLLGVGEHRDRIRLSTSDGLNWTVAVVEFDAIGRDTALVALPSLATPEGRLLCLTGVVGSQALDGLRVWERTVTPVTGIAELPLRFRVVPRVWPEIALGDADGSSNDVTAEAHEIQLRCDPGLRGAVVLDVAGIGLTLRDRILTAGPHHLSLPRSGPFQLTLHLQADCAALTIDELPPVLLAAGRVEAMDAVAVTHNVAHFTVGSRAPASGRLRLEGDAVLLDGRVRGLRKPVSSLYRRTRDRSQPGELFYESDSFSIRAHEVQADSDQPALVPDRITIVSPIRVVEEFAWRPTPYGDMTRVVDRCELWRSRVEPGRFPTLHTRFATVDATFELAMETFQRNAGAEFALPGQVGVWSAGYFQGPGLGFGSWRRDSSQIALRGGNLLDPDVSRASLAHVLTEGFDNGSDGDSLPVVAAADYVHATGDDTLALQVWAELARCGDALDARFDHERGLVEAPQSTSNDCFAEPEAGGFALSTEVYSMQTYAALAELAALPGISDERADRWAARAGAMRATILDQYWSQEHGFFTSGPRGSTAHRKGYWETSGAEAVLWGFLGPAAEAKAPSVLTRLREVALSEFGVVLFPYKPADNHFCNSVWYCWQAGIARAAARAGDADLIHQLIAQQVRTVIRNKTFYEVTQADTGESWRWPGQLWHAAGFASLLLYGVFGLAYDRDGMTFAPAASQAFDGAQVRGLRYREAVLDLELRGHGTRARVLLDDRPVRIVPADTVGHHTVVLELR